jgi:hypothetical protein
MTEPDICAAPDELVALARAVRPHWDHDVLASAILAAKVAGWTWARTLTETVRLMCDADGSPFDLKAAAAHPFRPAGGQPADGSEPAAAAREMYPNLRRPSTESDVA